MLEVTVLSGPSVLRLLVPSVATTGALPVVVILVTTTKS